MQMANFCLDIELLVKLHEKSKCFEKLTGKIEIFFKLPEKIEILGKFSRKNRIFYPDPRPPQISNQIDALSTSACKPYGGLCIFSGALVVASRWGAAAAAH